MSICIKTEEYILTVKIGAGELVDRAAAVEQLIFL